jgi:hypothetical protein
MRKTSPTRSSVPVSTPSSALISIKPQWTPLRSASPALRATPTLRCFYYSGHAMQYAGINYLAPTGAKLTDEADLRLLERVDDIVADLQRAKNLRPGAGFVPR